MSSRAIQRLREERGGNDLEPNLDHIEEEEEEDRSHRQGAFLAMMDDSDSESEEDEVEDEERSKQAESAKDTEAECKTAAGTTQQTVAQQKKVPDQLQDEQEEEEEDLDAILAEFESKDVAAEADDSKPSAPWFHVLVSSVDARDLDIDYVMRTLLLGGTEDVSAPATSRRSRQSFLFGPPRDGWVRAPHFVGGGIGMNNYCDAEGGRQLPWPYSSSSEDESLTEAYEQWQNPKNWFTFVHSDTYRKDLEDYERIQNSGDVNALALFVAHHPFVVEALLQLAIVLYRTNQSQEGLSLLRRSLWTLECSSLPSFRPLHGASCFMDYDKPENASYFLALFRLIQISGMQGCVRTSLAVSRYVLALDPLRDPMGILVLLDYFALMAQNSKYDKFLVDLIESNKITLKYKDNESCKCYSGNLLELPNWAYSFSLALYRLSQQADGNDDLSNKSNEALQAAIRKFPAVVEALLIKNAVDTTGRSTRTDWPTVLHNLRTFASNPVDSEDYDPITQHAASQASDLIVNIFVQRNHSLWSGDDIIQWMYKNCTSLFPSDKDAKSLVRPQLCHALIRYAHCDPSDYEDRFQTLPQDANPLDPGLLPPALAVDPNRRRFLRRANMPAARAGDLNDEIPAIFQGGGLMIGGPPANVIDPDDPLVEVLWRSMLPWNTVDGVPPPRR